MSPAAIAILRAKGGISAITRSLAVAYAPQRVRVNAIAPSATMTDRVKKLIAGNAALTELADSHLLGAIEPHDIANMALHLASDESRMVTGQVLPVDSGVTISWNWRPSRGIVFSSKQPIRRTFRCQSARRMQGKLPPKPAHRQISIVGNRQPGDPRVPSWEAFGRRPSEHARITTSGPASEGRDT